MLSLTDMADKMNLLQGERLFVEIWPIDLNYIVIRFADQFNTTVAHHKFLDDEMIAGFIVMWSGAIVDIPDGYALCNGDNGTPDLRDRFIVGAGDSYDPDDNGGAVLHHHDFTGDGHAHTLVGYPAVLPDNWPMPQETHVANAVGTTDNEDGRPPYWALAFIMKL